jgi:hypothetical protein
MRSLAIIALTSVLVFLIMADYTACRHHRLLGGALATSYEIQCESRYGNLLPDFHENEEED